MNTFALHGHIIYSLTKDRLAIQEYGYLICEQGISKGVYQKLPAEYEGIKVVDYGDKLIMPGLVDLHVHAPQFTYRGLGMDLELLDWLNTYTYPEESAYVDLCYAKHAYQQFAEALQKSATTRAGVFATLHVPATKLLMELLEKTGVKTFVGKVNMDRNSPDCLCEKSAEESIQATREWVDDCLLKFENSKPILTPRFIPTCTDELMLALAKLQGETGLPVQSHLSENEGEIAWVQELCPDSKFYGDAYDRLGLFGSNGRAIMAHCVHSSTEEIALMKERGVYIAHCPQSNTNLASGIAPVKRYLEEGLLIGLGSDIAGGYDLSIFQAMAEAIKVSKLRFKLKEDKKYRPLTIEEAFYMGTKGGGAFFGKVGSFECGYELDAVVVDDGDLATAKGLSVKDRLERVIYLSRDEHIVEKYVAGRHILKI
ncbi:amidohydrolase family protein [Lachnospiraceae bacterium ZAX-1]